MKRFSQQLHTAAKRVTMTKAESRELKDRLVAYMEYHPLPEHMKQAAPTTAAIQSESFWVWQFNTVRNRAFASMFVLATLIIVPFAAERAMPGDMLYPVKVSFNEEVRSSLTLSPYEKVEWETARVERRLAEARLLANEGKLTEDIEAEVAAAVKTHSSAAQASIATIRETNRDEAAIAELSFASALEVESEVLEQETERQAAVGASTTATIAAAIADVRASVGTNPDNTDVAFDRLLARVEEETTRATELLASFNGEVSDEERADINRRLEDIDRKISLAHNAKAGTAAPEAAASATGTAVMMAAVAPDEVTAKQHLREALRDTQKLIHFMTDIDVKLNVSIDELVPVTPTDEERAARIRSDLEQVEVLGNQIEASGNTEEKTLFGLRVIAELVEDAEKALVVKNHTEAETAVREALALSIDLAASLETETSTPSTPATTTEPVEPTVQGTSTATTSTQAQASTTPAGVVGDVVDTVLR